MSSGYRRIIMVALIGWGLAIIGSGLWVYYLDNPITENNISAHRNDAPTQKIAPRLERIARALEFMEKGVNSQENEDRARRDLAAQEGAWRWTKWAVWMAAVQAVLSGIGIAFVVLSLRQGQSGLAAARRALRYARVANQIANDIGQKQLRAYLDFDGVRFIPFAPGRKPDASSTGIAITIRNYGQTPAMNVIVDRQFFMSVRNGERVGLLPDETSQSDEFGAIAPSDHGHFNSKFDMPNYLLDAIGQRVSQFKVSISVEYFDIFDARRTLTCEFVNDDISDNFIIVSGTRKHT